MMFNKFIIYK